MAGEQYTDDQIVDAIPGAIAECNFRAVIGMIHMLALRDPERARRILDSISASIDLARLLP